MDAVILDAQELSAASSDIALSHEALLLLLPFLPLDCRARAACVCRAWRAATAHPALWEALSFECCTARVTNAALSSLCACAGAALRTLRLDANVCADVTPDGMLAALRGGVCTGVQCLHAPYVSVDKTMFSGRVLTAGMAQELAALCPMLQYSEFSVRNKLSDAVAVLGLLPGPLTLRCARNNHIYDESDLSRLAACPHVNAALKSLTLHKYCIGVSGVTQLATCLHVNAVLKSLSLTESGIGSAEAAQLAGFLRENATLTSLNLLNNNIGDEGTVHLAESLRVNTTLSGLCLRLNGIGVAGATQLADCLRVNVTLTRLQLGERRHRLLGRNAAGRMPPRQRHAHVPRAELLSHRRCWRISARRVPASQLHTHRPGLVVQWHQQVWHGGAGALPRRQHHAHELGTRVE